MSKSFPIHIKISAITQNHKEFGLLTLTLSLSEGDTFITVT